MNVLRGWPLFQRAFSATEPPALELPCRAAGRSGVTVPGLPDNEIRLGERRKRLDLSDPIPLNSRCRKSRRAATLKIWARPAGADRLPAAVRLDRTVSCRRRRSAVGAKPDGSSLGLIGRFALCEGGDPWIVVNLRGCCRKSSERGCACSSPRNVARRWHPCPGGLVFGADATLWV
jgi:hypothetical protein